MTKPQKDEQAQAPYSDADAQAQATNAPAQEPLKGGKLGELAFTAYNAQAGGKTYDGKDTPAWGDLGAAVQANWEAAARAVMAEAVTMLTPPMLPEQAQAEAPAK